MSGIINLDIFRDNHLLVEGECTEIEIGPVIKWTITGENRQTVQDAANKLVRLAEGGIFSDPVLLRHNWFQSIGYTLNNESFRKEKKS